MKCEIDIIHNGVPANPDTVNFKYKSPEDSSVVTVPGLAPTSTGHYEASFVLDYPGIWSVRFEWSNAAPAYQGAKEWTVCCRRSEFI